MKNLKSLIISGALISALVVPLLSSAVTVDELNVQINALLQQIQQLQSQLQSLISIGASTGSSTPTPTMPAGTVAYCSPSMSYNLYFGLTDNDSENQVSQAQNFLAQWTDIYPEGLVTGYYGPLTESAIKKFQCNHGIVCSGAPETTGYGAVGPLTRAKIRCLCGWCSPTPTPSFSPTPLATPISTPSSTPTPAVTPTPSPSPLINLNATNIVATIYSATSAQGVDSCKTASDPATVAVGYWDLGNYGYCDNNIPKCQNGSKKVIMADTQMPDGSVKYHTACVLPNQTTATNIVATIYSATSAQGVDSCHIYSDTHPSGGTFADQVGYWDSGNYGYCDNNIPKCQNGSKKVIMADTQMPDGSVKYHTACVLPQ
ncbi:peptidoglycan-binding protein [Patescibacteria group bacterium]|nr:peptidoglycan-binding protein [Patescibacteria group bacterium]